MTLSIPEETMVPITASQRIEALDVVRGFALLGIFIIGGVGFSHIEALHNAAHDYRHSMAFPCH